MEARLFIDADNAALSLDQLRSLLSIDSPMNGSPTALDSTTI